MPTMNSLRDVFVHELQDLYSAERQLVRVLPKLSKNVGNPSLSAAFEEHLHETEKHVKRLERALRELDESLGRTKCRGMEGLIEEGDELLHMEGDRIALDAAIIGAARRVEHYEIAAYTGAIAQAEALGRHEIARLLRETLAEEEKADRTLTQLGTERMTDLTTPAPAGEIPVLGSESMAEEGTTRKVARSGISRTTHRRRNTKGKAKTR